MIRPHAFATSLAALCAAGPLAAQTAEESPAARTAATEPATPASPTAAPDQTAAAVQLPPILLYSAARDYRDLLDTPAPATVLEAEDIADRAPSTYEDLLGDVPGVNIGGGPRGISQEPNIRGFDDDQVVIRVDGARQTFNGGHRGRFFTDPEALKRVEVLRGGASTLYGSGAMGGVIALETKDAEDYLDPEDAFGGRLGGAWSSQGNEFLAHGAAAARWDRFDAMGFLSWRPMGSDLEDGDGDPILNSEIDAQSAIAKLGFEPNAANRFEASFQAYRDDGETPPNANAASTPSTVVNRELDHQSGRLQWDYSPAGSDLWNLTALAYVTRVELSEDRPADGRRDDTEQTTYGVEATNVSRLNPGLPVTLSYGVEAYRDDYSASRDGAARLQSPDASLTFAAVFAQGDIELGHNLTLTPGLRYDHFSVDPDGTFDDRSEGQLSPRLALSWRPTPGAQLYASAAQSFRAPQASELYASGVHFSVPGFSLGPGAAFTGNNVFVPNPDLEPEKALQFEVGGKWRLDDVAARGDRVTFSAAAYYAEVQDFVNQTVQFIDFSTGAFNPISGLFEVNGSTTVSNVDAVLWGFEAEARYDDRDWYAGLGLSIPRGRAQDGGPLGSIPQDKLFLTAGYHPLSEVELGARVTFRNGVDEAEAAPQTDGSAVFDLFVQWTPDRGPLEGARFLAGVDNVFDETYRLHPNELNQPGRAFKIAASVAF